MSKRKADADRDTDDEKAQKVDISNSDIPAEFYCFCANIFLYPVMLECGHVFCRSCIQRTRLLNDNCPLCRAKIKFTSGYNAHAPTMERMLEFNRKMVIDRILESSADENSIRNLIHLSKCLGIETCTYNEKWTSTLLINNTFHLHFTYSPKTNSLMMYAVIIDIDDRTTRLQILEKYLKLQQIISAEKEVCAAGLVPGKSYIILRRSLDMLSAKDDALRNSAITFVALVEKYIGKIEFAPIKSIMMHTPDELSHMVNSVTYYALNKILKAWEFKLPDVKFAYDESMREIVTSIPIYILPTDADKRLDKLEQICSKLLYSLNGLYLIDNTLFLVTRTPVTTAIMIDPDELKKKLLDINVMEYYKWREFIASLE